MRKRTEKRKDRRISITTLRMLVFALAIAAITATFAHSIAWGENEQRKSEQTSTEVFELLDTKTLEGETFTSEEFKGSRLTMVNVWETTCPACLGEMPDLEKISKQYDPSEFQIVGICYDAVDRDGPVNEGRLKKAIEQMKDAGVTFPNIIPTPDVAQFIKATVAGFPTSFFVDSQGKVVDIRVGASDEATWKAEIDQRLADLDR